MILVSEIIDQGTVVALFGTASQPGLEGMSKKTGGRLT